MSWFMHMLSMIFYVDLCLKISFHKMKLDGINTRQVANRLPKNRKDTLAKDDIS